MPDLSPHFPNFFKQELIGLVLEPTTKITMRATVKANGLAVQQEKFEVQFVAKLVEPRLGATIMIMTMVMSKTRYLKLKLKGWSCHDVGVRGVPGDVRHGGVRSCHSCCLGGVPRGIGHDGVHFSCWEVVL